MRFVAFGQKEGLPDGEVGVLAAMSDGSLWVGTSKGGLARWNNGRFSNWSIKLHLPRDAITALLQDRDGNLWIAFKENGLGRVVLSVFTRQTHRDGLPSDNIRSLLEDREGNLWIGTFEGGLLQFRDAKFTPFREREGIPNPVSGSDGQGLLHNGDFAGPTRAGLDRYKWWRDRTIPRWKITHCPRSIRSSANSVTTIIEGADGDLWIGTEGGLQHFSSGTLKKTYTTKDALLSDCVFSLYSDAERALWIGTAAGGLNRFKEGRVAAFSIEQGLYNSTVGAIAEDTRGNLWMTSNKGIFRVSKSQLNDVAAGRAARVRCIAYGIPDGLRSQECNFGSVPPATHSNDGRLWFPTIAGVVAIDPDRILTNKVAPPVFIERVLFDGSPVAPGTGGTVAAGPGHGSLDVQFTAVSFVAPERVHFRYKLDGFDPDWTDSGARREAYYTNLPPGSYTFRLRHAPSERS